MILRFTVHERGNPATQRSYVLDWPQGVAQMARCGESRYVQILGEQRVAFDFPDDQWIVCWLEWTRHPDGHYSAVADIRPTPESLRAQNQERLTVTLVWALQAIETLAVSTDDAERRELAAEAHRRAMELRR